MIRKSLLLKIFDAAFMQRWNDKVRPVEFTELDKQAHKMVIAYFLGKFEESTPGFDWIEVIEGGLFDFLQRLVLTDIKPPIFYKIKSDREKYRKLNEWVFNELRPFLSPLGKEFSRRFQKYFSSEKETVNHRILNAAHFYATKMEFDIIERANPEGFETEAIREDLRAKQKQYSDLKGFQELAADPRYQRFLKLCGQLRFQTRWANLHRIPKTSVMGHMLIVAIFTYIFSLEIKACPRRRINNYFTGLFHDLPEVLTRDIISPVKRSVEGLSELIKEYEKEMMEKEVYIAIPSAWRAEFKMFTEYEFANLITQNGKLQNLGDREIGAEYNQDEYRPRDGKLVKAADHLAAFLEAYVAVKNGSASQELLQAQLNLKREYQRAENESISGINFVEIYEDFD